MAVLKDNGCAISSKQHFSIAKGNYAISTLIYLEKLTLIRKTASKNILIFFDKYWLHYSLTQAFMLGNMVFHWK